MAKLIVIDGPEKAGKTTFIQALVEAVESSGQRVIVKHWSMPDLKTFHSFVYRDWISEAFASVFYDVIIWDRSWVSEYVYPSLMPQFRSSKRVMWGDPWIGEWCFGRALKTYGLGVVLLGPSVEALERLRDATDHNCPVFAERELYQSYGETFNWVTLHNDHDQGQLQVTVGQVLDALRRLDNHPTWLRPPVYCGPPGAQVVFMGEALTTHQTPKTWLPFSSQYTMMLGREFGDYAFDFGWTNAMSLKYAAHASEVQKFFRGKLVVACGAYAQDYCDHNNLDSYHISHPAHGFRWGTRVEEYRAAIGLLKNELATRGVYRYEDQDSKEGRGKEADCPSPCSQGRGT